MDDLLEWSGEVVRWTGPLIAFVITVTAWKRYRARGTSLAVAGLLVILLTPLARTVIFEVWIQESTRRAVDVATILSIIGAVSGVGMLVLVVALRKVIASAEELDVSRTSGVNRS